MWIRVIPIKRVLFRVQGKSPFRNAKSDFWTCRVLVRRSQDVCVKVLEDLVKQMLDVVGSLGNLALLGPFDHFNLSFFWSNLEQSGPIQVQKSENWKPQIETDISAGHGFGALDLPRVGDDRDDTFRPNWGHLVKHPSYPTGLFNRWFFVVFPMEIFHHDWGNRWSEYFCLFFGDPEKISKSKVWCWNFWVKLDRYSPLDEDSGLLFCPKFPLVIPGPRASCRRWQNHQLQRSRETTTGGIHGEPTGDTIHQTKKTTSQMAALLLALQHLSYVYIIYMCKYIYIYINIYI